MRQKILALKNRFFQVNARTIYLYALAVGVMSGFVAILFHELYEALSRLVFERGVGASLGQLSPNGVHFFDWPTDTRRYWLLILPAVGGLLAGLVTHFLSAEARGSGIDEYLDAFHNHHGFLRKRTPFAKLLATLATLTSGGSAGKEGPTALIGAGLGSLLAKFTKMGERARRTLFLAGAAGGLGAIFRAPLGGAITAIEVLYKEDFETDALVPCIISSVTAYTLYASHTGFGPILAFHARVFHTPLQFLFYVVLGLLCTGLGFLFVKLFHFFKNSVVTKIPVHPIFLPALGGLGLGLLGFFHPEVLGDGLTLVQRLLSNGYVSPWWGLALFFLFLALLKMLATTLTIQFGGSGGALVPSLLMGGLMGASFGQVCHHFFPTLVPDVTVFVIVGMAAFFAAVTNASLGTLVIVCELTGGYALLPPLMLVSVISLILSHRWSLYTQQVQNKFHSPAHHYDLALVARPKS